MPKIADIAIIADIEVDAKQPFIIFAISSPSFLGLWEVLLLEPCEEPSLALAPFCEVACSVELPLTEPPSMPELLLSGILPAPFWLPP